MSKFLNVGVIWTLRNDEHFQFHWNALSYLTAELTNLPPLTDAHAEYKRLFDQEDVIFKHMQKMLGTEDVKSLDKLRLSIFSSLNFSVKAAQKSLNITLNQAGKTLYPVFEAYKGLSKRTFNGKTAYFTNLLQDLAITEKAAAISTLQLTETVEALAEANDNFIAAYKLRSDEAFNHRAEGNMSEIMPLVNHAFNEVLDILDAIYVANELIQKDADMRTAMDKLIANINALLLNTVRTVAYRNSGVNSGDPDVPPGPGPVVLPIRFRATGQGFFENSVKMFIKAPDKEVLRSGIDDLILDAIINFQTEENPNRFTINSILRPDTADPDEIHLLPTDNQDLLGSISGPEITVEAIKDGEVVLIIDGVQAPDGFA